MEELLYHHVTQNIQAERSVLGAMLIDPSCVPDGLKGTQSDFFCDAQNRDIYDTVAIMHNSGETIDAVTVMDKMRIRGVLRETTQGYLMELMRSTPTTANLGLHVKILQDKALVRNLGETARKIEEMVTTGIGSADEMLETAERTIYNLRKDRAVGGLKPISDVVVSVIDEMNRKASGEEQDTGLTTGFVDLDKRILGMYPGELFLIASRPGMGKTSIALNIATHVAKKYQKQVAIFSLEMSREQLVKRILSFESMVESEILVKGATSPEQWQRIIAAASKISTLPILIDDNSSLSVADMNAQCRRVRDLGLVIIDYLQLMQSAGGKHSAGENRQQQVADMSRMLKIMAKDLGVPVICMSQLNRSSEARQDKRPMLSDLRESGAIEQDADAVIGLYREGYYNKGAEDQTAAEAIILKNRKGQTGTVPLIWLANYTMYLSADTVHKE